MICALCPWEVLEVMWEPGSGLTPAFPVRSVPNEPITASDFYCLPRALRVIYLICLTSFHFE